MKERGDAVPDVCPEQRVEVVEERALDLQLGSGTESEVEREGAVPNGVRDRALAVLPSAVARLYAGISSTYSR
jgi:hypothetical protein